MQKSYEKVLLIIRGTPGAGKTTIAKALLLVGLFHYYYEADMFFELEGHYKYDKSKIKAAHEWCYSKVKDAMYLGEMNVIVSNTFTSKWQYQKYLDLAAELGYNIQMMVLKSDFESIHQVPKDTLIRMKNELQTDLALDWYEGDNT